MLVSKANKMCRTKPNQEVKDCYTENLKTLKREIKEYRSPMLMAGIVL